jgi:hypothetical protein
LRWHVLIGEGGEGCVFNETGGARGEGDGHQNMHFKTHIGLLVCSCKKQEQNNA